MKITVTGRENSPRPAYLIAVRFSYRSSPSIPLTETHQAATFRSPRPYHANHNNSLPISRTPSRREQTTPVRKPRRIPTPLRARMTGMLDIERVYNRRGDRTFAGGRCVVCEEPLEHTLRGERFLQLTCSHVSHEACFYEFIRDIDSQQCPECRAPLGLDPGRGGNIVNLGKKPGPVFTYYATISDAKQKSLAKLSGPTKLLPNTTHSSSISTLNHPLLRSHGILDHQNMVLTLPHQSLNMDMHNLTHGIRAMAPPGLSQRLPL